MPTQAVVAADVVGRVELDDKYAAGLEDIAGFSHLLLLCHLHRVERGALTVTPFLDNQPHGVFATRAPKNANPIALSTRRLLRVKGATLHISELDLLDGTPVRDIKPYVPAFDDREGARIGWFADRIAHLGTTRADDSFR